MADNRVIQLCNDCKKLSIFEINESQDPLYFNGKRLRECVECGRYEEIFGYFARESYK